MSGSFETAETTVGAGEKLEPKKLVTMTVCDDGIAMITLDDVSASVNAITPELGAELMAAIDRIERESLIRGAVIASGKADSFIVGAKIEVLRSIKLAQDAERMARELAKGFARLAKLKKPVVAAVHGPALGGGFELALACRAIVVSDDKKTVLGLPEVSLGVLPGANGLLRVAERAGLQVALDVGLTGKHLRAEKAKRLGLVDEVCPQAVLLDAARARVRALLFAGPVTPKPARKLTLESLTQMALEKNPIGRALLFKKAREETHKKTHGHYPATERIIEVLERFARKGFAPAAELEARLFGELVVSETSHRLIEIFFATTALKKDAGIDDKTVPAKAVDNVVVLGGGLMGGGIAYVTANAGAQVRVKEKDDAALGRGLKHVRTILDERVKKKQSTRLERDATFARVTGTTDFSGVSQADVVIEAIFEDLALKQAMLREVEAVAQDDCIFASNTSSIPIARIAQASKHPETVIGMHYFSPVHKMPLLEVVRTDRTAPWVVATAVALGKRQGKTVIVVKDGVGFYTSRVLAPYMNEAAHLLSEGVAIEAIDTALVDWGFPVGPIQLLDEVGIDVAAHVGAIVHAAFGDRMTPPALMSKLAADNRKGRKNERGFYLYGDSARETAKRAVDVSVYKTLGIEPRGKLPAEEIQQRCALQFVNEALLCFGEGILRSPRDGDVGAIFGLGFPPFRGGPFRYVDAIGAAEILRRVQGYYDRFGKRWTPAPALVEMAKKGERFYRE